MKKFFAIITAIVLGVLAGIGFLLGFGLLETVNIPIKAESDQLRATIQNLEDQNRQLRDKLTTKTEQLKKQEQRTRELVRKLRQQLKDEKDSKVESDRGIVTINIPNHILFEEASSKLSRNEISVLRKISETLKEHPDREIRVQGHADTYPLKPGADYESNWELSAHRAVNVLKYLVYAQGINRKRIGAVAFGQFRPINTKVTEEAQATNRRVEIVLYPGRYVD